MVDKSASADLRATKMLIDMMKDVEHKASDAAPPPEPRRPAAADKEVVHQFVAVAAADLARNGGSEGGRAVRIAFPAGIT
jgi:hypothetical protein